MLTDTLAARLHAASRVQHEGRDSSKGELGALLDIWSDRRDDNPAWCRSPEPYRYMAARLLKLGAAPQAKEVARTALEHQLALANRESHRPWAHDVELRLAYGMSLARTSNAGQAQQFRGELHDQLHMTQERPLDAAEKHIWQETLGMLGRTYKDQSVQATEPAVKRKLWQQSLQCYERAYRLTGGYWTGINVATLARLSGDQARA